MALDKEFFDSVNIDVVKKKYYNANKVNALLGNIQQQAETMGQENELLRTQLEALNGQKSEIGDTLLSARALAKKIEDQARAQAEETIRQAQEKADAIVREAEHKRRELAQSLPDQQEYAAKCVENCLNKLKKQHIEAIEMLNNEWQDFLCGLMPEEHSDEAESGTRRRRRTRRICRSFGSGSTRSPRSLWKFSIRNSKQTIKNGCSSFRTASILHIEPN